MLDGAVADLNDFPFLVRIAALHNGAEKLICTGTLITENHVLTTSSCVKRQASAFSVMDNLDNLYFVYSIKPDYSQYSDNIENISILKVNSLLI